MSQFIEVHTGENSTPKLINLDYVRYIAGSSIIRVEGGPITCNESYAELSEKIKKAGALNGCNQSE